MPPGHPEPSSGSGAPRDLSALLVATASGEREAEERLLALTYDELHRLARSYLAQERPGHTLQPTALVNEAWMRLFGTSGLDLTERGRFLSLAARAMRRVLVDHARARIREKRGGGGGRVPIDTSLIAPDR